MPILNTQIVKKEKPCLTIPLRESSKMKDLAYAFFINASLACIYLLLISMPSRTSHPHVSEDTIPRPAPSEQKLNVHRISNLTAVQSSPLYLMTANEPQGTHLHVRSRSSVTNDVSAGAAPTLLLQSACQAMVRAEAPAELLDVVEALNDTVRVLKMIEAC